MPIEYVCDHCGKRELAVPGKEKWERPSDAWFERANFQQNSVQAACSKECAVEISKKIGIEPQFVTR